MYPSIHNEKFFPTIKEERRQPEKQPPYPPSLTQQSTALSYDRRYSDDDEVDDNRPDDSTALVISTRDLMAIDKRQADLAIAMDNMHLLPPANYTTGPSPGTSPHGHYLPAPPNAGLLPSADQSGLSPHFVPTVPPPPYGSSPPPVLHSNSMSAPAIPGAGASLPGQSQRCSRLAPDSHGHDIPLDASWTRIKRSLVSPEVLHQAGVRFEARPDFVAILGVFSKEDISEFARRSAEVRRRRMGQRKPRERSESQRYHPDKYKNWDVETQKRNGNGLGNRPHADSQFSSSSDLYDSSGDSSDDELPPYRSRNSRDSYSEDSKDHEDADEKGTKVYPFIVPPPDKDRGNGASPAATVKPKPILKNKNADPHVRFDPEPKVLNDGSTPRSVPQSRSSHRDRDERERRYRDDRYAARSYDDRDHHRDSAREHGDRGGENRGERERGADRHRGGEDDYRRGHHSRHHHGGSSDNTSRPRGDRYSARRRGDRYRDDGDRSEDRIARKKARGETLRAVGIGGAAASLLSVLTEAAAGL